MRASLPDTNAIVRYLVRDDAALFDQADAYFSKVKSGGIKIIILESVLAECVFVLVHIYKVPRQMIADSLANLLHYRGVVNHDRDIFIESLKLFASGNLAIVDCLLIVRAKGAGSDVFSFDRALVKKLTKERI